MKKFSALTVRNEKIIKVIKSSVGICLPFLLSKEKAETKIQVIKFEGIWDTGATGSVITKKVVDKLDLKPIRVAEVHHAGGVGISNVYLLNMVLPCNVVIGGVEATEGVLPGDSEVLIGMDIISLGDFSITNFDKKTCMSFRMPSCAVIDYVQEANNIRHKS